MSYDDLQVKTNKQLNLEANKQEIGICKLQIPCSNASLPFGKQRYIFNWRIERVQNRITEIVSNKYRNSYYKAAMLAAGVAEVMSEVQNEKASSDFLMKWNETFNRHSAFRKELRKYAKRSEIPSVSNTASDL